VAICGAPFDAGPTAPQLSVTVSIGVAEFEDSNDTLANMLQRADEALYRAKREGRNRVISEAA
jgi:two-component system cell cycle response regulator